jgi:hypothetical protein
MDSLLSSPCLRPHACTGLLRALLLCALLVGTATSVALSGAPQTNLADNTVYTCAAADTRGCVVRVRVVGGAGGASEVSGNDAGGMGAVVFALLTLGAPPYVSPALPSFKTSIGNGGEKKRGGGGGAASAIFTTATTPELLVVAGGGGGGAKNGKGGNGGPPGGSGGVGGGTIGFFPPRAIGGGGGTQTTRGAVSAEQSPGVAGTGGGSYGSPGTGGSNCGTTGSGTATWAANGGTICNTNPASGAGGGGYYGGASGNTYTGSGGGGGAGGGGSSYVNTAFISSFAGGDAPTSGTPGFAQDNSDGRDGAVDIVAYMPIRALTPTGCNGEALLDAAYYTCPAAMVATGCTVGFNLVGGGGGAAAYDSG